MSQSEANSENQGAQPPEREASLAPEAQRALAEAEARRQIRQATETKAATEIAGRNGPDPVRFGDWETGGIASDF
ncbi:MAG: DUF1674 domain-containing protein [Hyphomicrobium sp.]